MATPAQIKATQKFNQKTYDQVNIRLPKGMRDKIQDHAALTDESVREFVIRAIREQIARDRAEGRTKAPED